MNFEQAYNIIRDRLLEKSLELSERSSKEINPEVAALERDWAKDVLTGFNEVTGCYNEGDFDKFLEYDYTQLDEVAEPIAAGW